MEKSKRPVKWQKKAPQKKYEKDELIFGVQTVLEALKSDKDIDKILIVRESSHPELYALAAQRNVHVQKVPVEKLNRITSKNHQGVLAFVSAVNFAQVNNVVSEVFESGEVPFVLVLDRVTDVRNFGAICRTAECAGIQAVVVPQIGAAPITSDAMKTSSGALSHIPICKEPRLGDTISELQSLGLKTVAITEKSDKIIFDANLTGPVALILGSEEDGISDDILDRVDLAVQIPMKGRVGSLNVSVAAGIAIFEVNRQNQG